MISLKKVEIAHLILAIIVLAFSASWVEFGFPTIKNFALAALFFLLTARDLTGSTEIGIIAGYEGMVCGLSAVYLAIAEVINEVQGKTVLPICPTN